MHRRQGTPDIAFRVAGRPDARLHDGVDIWQRLAAVETDKLICIVTVAHERKRNGRKAEEDGEGKKRTVFPMQFCSKCSANDSSELPHQ